MIDWMLPSLTPTGKPVEVAFAVIVGFKEGKISYERIYWDQGFEASGLNHWERIRETLGAARLQPPD